MGIDRLENANPQLFPTKSRELSRKRQMVKKKSFFDPDYDDSEDSICKPMQKTLRLRDIYQDSGVDEPLDAEEVFELIRDINDPEHPYTLEQLNVVQEDLIHVYHEPRGIFVDVKFTPTIPHCSMATLIGLAIRVKLGRTLHSKVKTLVSITPGTHNSEEAINRQLADKERVAAAMENAGLMAAVNQCLRLPE